MKKITSILTFISLFAFSKAQLVQDSISNGPGYTTQSFYSLEDGEVSNVNNKDWDIAFSLVNKGAAGSAILLNELTADLWAVPHDTSFWASFDTTGYTSWKRLFNSDTTWTNGAYNKHRGLGPNGTFDMGWGYLDPSNNFWTLGDSLYLCKLGNGDFKKVWIESLKQGTWTFKYANIDGSNETSASFAKADYPNKNFIYYSMETNAILDREPDNNTWELTFTGHKDQLFPGYVIPVVSVFSNRTVWTAKTQAASYTDAVAATEAETDFTQKIDNIGREWKKYSSGQWSIYDTTAYFIYDVDSVDLYRIVFTNFTGASQGKSYFNKEKIVLEGIQSVNNKVNFALYPNPTVNYLNVIVNIEQPEDVVVSIYNTAGQLINTLERKQVSQTQVFDINTSDLNKGLYHIKIEGNSFFTTKSFVKN